MVCLIAVRCSVSGRTGCRQEVSQRDVRAYTRSTSRSLAGEQNKSAVTDHAISLNHIVDRDRQRRQQNGQMDQGGDTYQEGARQVDEQRRGVLPTLSHLRHPVRPETERRTAIRQTVPTKAPVKPETSTLINKRLCI